MKIKQDRKNEGDVEIKRLRKRCKEEKAKRSD